LRKWQKENKKMTTESDLVNRAYAQIGESVVLSSLSEDSVEARNGKIAYERARDYHLNSFSWSFCKKRIAPALMESEIEQYAYCYALPADFISIIALFPYGANADFQSNITYNYTRQIEYSIPLVEDYCIEPHSQATRAIYTNSLNPTLYYTASITDPNLFSEHLKEAIIYTTADYLLAVTIGGSNVLNQSVALKKMAELELQRAQAFDINQTSRLSRNPVLSPYMARFQ
jgi:hypothetical protein